MLYMCIECTHIDICTYINMCTHMPEACTYRYAHICTLMDSVVSGMRSVPGSYHRHYREDTELYAS